MNLLGDTGTNSRSLVSKSYVDDLIAGNTAVNWSSHPALTGVNMNSKTVTLNPFFTMSQGTETNQPVYTIMSQGARLLTFYGSSGGTNSQYSLSYTVSGTNLVFTVAQALLGGAPTIQTSTNFLTGWVDATPLASYASNSMWVVVLPATAGTYYRGKTTVGALNRPAVVVAGDFNYTGTNAQHVGLSNWVVAMMGTVVTNNHRANVNLRRSLTLGEEGLSASLNIFDDGPDGGTDVHAVSVYNGVLILASGGQVNANNLTNTTSSYYICPARSSAPTFEMAGALFTPVEWYSNSTPRSKWVTYYNGSTNAVSTNLFTLP